MSDFTVTFLGVRGGYPVPGPTTIEYGGNTTCLEVRAGPHLIVIDAGTGIIDLSNRLMAQHDQDQQPLIGTILFTHGHHDHMQGLPFFAPLHLQDSQFYILGPRMFDSDLRDVLARTLLPSIFPYRMNTLVGVREIRNIQDRETILLTRPDMPPQVVDLSQQAVFVPPWSVKIEMYLSKNHPKGGSMCYRIEYRGRRMVFATDTEGYEGGDTHLIDFARHADLLIHDAEYIDEEYVGAPFSRQGWGHSTWKIAVEVGQKADVKRLALTHHNARHDDAFVRRMEQEAHATFERSFMAREKLAIEL